MPKPDEELIARSVRRIRYAALDGAVILWPGEALAAPFSAILAKAWLPGAVLRVLKGDEAASSSPPAWLAALLSVEEIALGGIEPAEMCKRLGAETIIAGTLPPGGASGLPRWVAPLSGLPESALKILATTRITGPPVYDEHELVAVAMQRMRRLGYL